ncbi:MAG: response regulator [Lachnospiraceae bacterium]|nr:response regulator [Lachnospiraceae bacterium]
MKHAVRKNDVIVISLLVLFFLLIIGMNTSMVTRMMTEQTDQIGQKQLESIKNDLESNMSSAENVLIRVAGGAEQILGAEHTMDQLEEYIVWQKNAQLESSGGTNFNVYIAGQGWEIIPDFDIPEDYHATERSWYVGAVQSKGDIYITDPYVDKMTGEMCYTMSVLLSDGETVVSMDFTLSRILQSIKRMEASSESSLDQALIVTKDGLIVGYNDMSYVGEKLTEVLPKYEHLLEYVSEHSNKARSFDIKISGNTYTVFHSVTGNDWYMMILVDNTVLYGNTIRRIVTSIVINLLLLTFVVVFYIRSVRNRCKAENALKSREDFVAKLSEKLRTPVGNIIKRSDAQHLENSVDVKKDMYEIRADGMMINEMIEDLGSYSSIVSDMNKREHDEKKHRQNLTRSIRLARNIIIAVLLAMTAVSSLAVYIFNDNIVKDTVRSEAANYRESFKNWLTEKQTVLNMFTDIIGARPELMDDYDAAVKWMDSVAKNYSDISVVYMANPYKEHTVIMNNGWQPEKGWKVEERSWYIKTETSPSGYSISAPYYDEQTGGYCITISRVVYGSNKEFLGIFGIDIYLEELIDLFGQKRSDVDYVFMADANGDIINHPNAQYQMSATNVMNLKNTVYANVYDRAQQSININVLNDHDGRRVLVASYVDQSSGFSIYYVAGYWYMERMSIVFTATFALLVLTMIVILIVLLNNVIRSQTRMNAKLEDALEKATAAGNAKSDFLAQMSHEIRTPINAVIGMNEMILRESENRQITEYSENIKSASETLLKLINGILDFSKLESGKMEIVNVGYDTVALIDDLYYMLAEKAQQKGLSLVFDIDRKIPKTLYGDDVRIRQVITNLLTNAVKYTEKGSVTLRMGCVETSGGSCRLHISVADTGVGIRMEDMDRLFGSFERVDEKRNRNIEGTGLGMSIVSGLLEMMGSRLEVDSTYGKGSTFSFYLDQSVIDEKPIGKYEPGHASPGREKAAHEGKLCIKGADILAVDDNEMNLTVVKGLLKHCNVTPDTAQSGKECVEKVLKKHYDIILMDHMMPGMDGVETLNELKKRDLLRNKTAVIALTANAIVGARDKYLAEGFVDYLTKPIDPDKLEAMIVKYLPEEKYEYIGGQDAAAAMAEAVDESPKSFTEKLESKGFNVSAARVFAMNDDEFYKEILQTYIEEHPQKQTDIRKAFDEKNWKDYEVYVHALKSSSKTIGADELSAMALSHEKAAKEGRVDDIISGYEELVKKYEDVVNTIKGAIG